MSITERPKFLTELLAEVDSFDSELFRPNVEPEAGDRVIGVLSPWLRQLHALARYYHRQQMKLIAVDREYESVESVISDQEIAALQYKHDLLVEIMWVAIRAEHKVWTVPSVGVRVDWQVVTTNAEEYDEGFKQFLSFLMGRRK